jgi:competence protein ComEC
MWFRNGPKLTVFTQNAEQAKIDATAYGIGERLKNIQYKSLQNSYLINKEQILLIDSAGIYPKTGYNPRFIVLSGSPKVHLGRVIETLRPEMIIADGSNYWDYLTRWEITCHQYNIPFYATAKKGAFINNIDSSP